MEPLLDAVEARIVGALVEKQLTTPDNYPLTLNALTTACNQKSNRHPVVVFDERTVVRSLEHLRDKGLARMVSGADQRVPKYYHLFAEKLELSLPQVAALTVLILRGPQTLGEIRGRSGRLHEFADLDEVEQTLGELGERQQPMVVQLERQPGRKEARFAHLLCGEPDIGEEDQGEGLVELAALEVRAENERLAVLEQEVGALREELAALRRAFEEFTGQF
jgi:uncharacterized protein YceH (UPF0502 family)